MKMVLNVFGFLCGCQSIYDELAARMIANDADSLKLNTWVDQVKRRTAKMRFGWCLLGLVRIFPGRPGRPAYRCVSD